MPATSTSKRKNTPTWASRTESLGYDPVDTLAAIGSLRAQVPVTVAPLVLVSQVYSIITSSTVVDREIDSLCKAGTLRRFRLGSGRHAVMLMTDYLDQIRETLTDLAELSQRYSAFISSATHDGVDITRAVLVDKIQTSDDDITELLKAGFLTHKSVDEYYISARSIGVYWGSYIRGRQELLLWLKRKQFRQVLQSLLEQKTLKQCLLPSKLILADLLGCGFVELVVTPMGNMIKLTRKAEEGASSSR
ncbi:hypothetical protein SmJEL517_g02520 [Synchytrium microbalum]|uniref:Serine/threonine-protein kinase 19 n=1 Tax=Synchytrium microbalum TaxID=1806994 RepID=A0A507CAW5_9FUNG|nr:uncharacterized protein SmJEL517_g02520 [Synchytrium microbalum]TPX35094.1 hypothetical protein SmJEL517_g02520 [Synchytrium microbalum]